MYEYTIEVEEKDIDINGHVSNTKYLNWYVEAAVQHSEHLNLGYGFTKTLGVTWFAKEHHIYYKAPAFAGEKLQMQTWLESIGVSSAQRHYRLKNGEKVIGEAMTVWVMIDIKRQRPCRIPKEIIEAYQKTTL